MMTFMISGPITGVEDYRKNFKLAESFLKRKGYSAINPAIMPEGLTRADYMRVSLAQIEAVDAILMLPHWRESKGACIEKLYAEYLGKKVFFLHTGEIFQTGDGQCFQGPVVMEEGGAVVEH